MQQLKIELFEWDLEGNGSLWKIYNFTEKVTSKIQTGMEKSKFHLFGFFIFCENRTEMSHTEILPTLQGRAGDSRRLWTGICG